MFSFYNKHILPRLLDHDMRPAELNGTRSSVVESAKGIVLEVGFGSGYNLPFYRGIDRLYALDPSVELYAYAKDRIEASSFPIEHLLCSAEEIPLDDASIDTAVSTWSLCSIPNLPKALLEIKRVLKPNGKLLFVEHGKSTKKINAFIQRLLTPITRHFTGNCHLDRKIDSFIKDSGLYIEKIETFPEEGRPLMFSYRGIAIKK